MRPYPWIYSFNKHLLSPYRVLDTATHYKGELNFGPALKGLKV